MSFNTSAPQGVQGVDTRGGGGGKCTGGMRKGSEFSKVTGSRRNGEKYVQKPPRKRKAKVQSPCCPPWQ